MINNLNKYKVELSTTIVFRAVSDCSDIVKIVEQNYIDITKNITLIKHHFIS